MNLHGSVGICKDCKNMQNFTRTVRVCYDLQELQGSAMLSKGLQRSVRICKDLQGFANVCKGML